MNVRDGYDSTNPDAIPAAANDPDVVVFVYLNGPESQWPTGGAARFPRARKIHIDVGAPHPEPFAADVADIEARDYTPAAFASSFVAPRLARGWWSAGYAALSTIDTNLQLFAEQRDTVYWVADYSLSKAEAAGVLAGIVPEGTPNAAAWKRVLNVLHGRIVAVQYASPSSNHLPGYDMSVITEGWFPPVRPGPPPVIKSVIVLQSREVQSADGGQTWH